VGIGGAESARWRAVLIGVAALGGALRLRQFLSGRSLWRDEAAIVTDLRELSLVESLTGVSPGNQMAPPGFWAVQHAVYEVSSADAALRLLPLLSGLALVALTLGYATKALASPVARVFLVGSVSVSPSLVYYSAEVKQYATEAAVSMFLLLAVAERHRLGRGARFGVGVLAIVASPAGLVFVAALGLAWLLEEARDGEIRAALLHLLPPGFGLVAVALAFAGFVHETEPAYMDAFWVDSYGPAPIDGDSVRWWVDALLGLVHLATSQIGFAWHLPVAGWTSATNQIVSIAVVILVGGGAVTVHRRRVAGRARAGWLVAIPVTATFAVVLAGLSVLDLYPFRGRIILHLVPLLLVVAAHSLDVLLDRAGRVVAVLAVAAGSVIVLSAGWSAGGDAVDPFDTYDLTPALEWLDARAQRDDVVVLHADSVDLVEHYANAFDFDGARTVIVEGYFSGSAVDALAGPGRAWVIHAFVHDGARPLAVEALSHERVDAVFEREGVIAWGLRPLG